MSIRSVQIALIIALILCLLPMPYGYYTIVRVCTMVYFGYLAFRVNKKSKKNRSLLIFYLVVIILFQPFVKLPIGRLVWNIIDIGLAIWILLNLGRRR